MGVVFVIPESNPFQVNFPLHFNTFHYFIVIAPEHNVENWPEMDRSCFWSSHLEVLYKIGFLKISQNSQENICVRVFLNKVAGLLWHSCFPGNFAEFLRTLFFTENLRWLLLLFLKAKTIPSDTFKPTTLLNVVSFFELIKSNLSHLLPHVLLISWALFIRVLGLVNTQHSIRPFQRYLPLKKLKWKHWLLISSINLYNAIPNIQPNAMEINNFLMRISAKVSKIKRKILLNIRIFIFQQVSLTDFVHNISVSFSTVIKF